MPRLVVFLDDGGVMNDNYLRGGQWQRLVAEYFAPRLGGTPEAWAEANRVVITQILETGGWDARIAAAPSYASFDRLYSIEWLGEMCRLVGVPAPPDDECVALARDADDWITRRVHSAFPGAIDAIRTIHDRGYVLHTASNESSATLAGYLEAMGVRDCFGKLFGPDLVDAFKPQRVYYERIFADTGIDPADAVVVDDNRPSVEVAAEVGAWGVLVSASPQPDLDPDRRISALAELPRLLDDLR